MDSLSWGVPLWFVLSLALLALANRWFSQHLWNVAYLLSGDETVAGFVHFAVLLPGVLLHEASHWLTARLLGLKADRPQLWPEAGEGGLRLGSVRVQQADPLRNSLVGLAPLLFGTLVLLLVGQRVFGLNDLAATAADGQWHRLAALLASARGVADLWLWAYLVFAVANAMLPSQSDRYAWPTLGIYALLLGIIYWLLAGGLPSLPKTIWQATLVWLARLAGTFTLALAVDALFGALLLLAEAALLRLGRGEG
ncbi:MAG: hypothetical protein GX605_05505 [Chloroflexi bacterium]|nr:hypothetical protein [Chloroflexota bacterium]